MPSLLRREGPVRPRCRAGPVVFSCRGGRDSFATALRVLRSTGPSQRLCRRARDSARPSSSVATGLVCYPSPLIVDTTPYEIAPAGDWCHHHHRRRLHPRLRVSVALASVRLPPRRRVPAALASVSARVRAHSSRSCSSSRARCAGFHTDTTPPALRAGESQPH